MSGKPQTSDGAAFVLRPAASGDRETVRALVESGGMELANDWQDGTVAVDEAGAVVGYLRIQHTGQGPHVAPVAVRPDWQGRGVGRALMDHALACAGPLKLVSQGRSAGFYRAIGCSQIPFEQISGELDEDCRHCPDREACQPVAFVYTGEVRDDHVR